MEIGDAMVSSLFLPAPQTWIGVPRRHAEHVAVRITQLGHEPIGLRAVLGGVRCYGHLLFVAQQQTRGEPTSSKEQRRQRLQLPSGRISGGVFHIHIYEMCGLIQSTLETTPRKVT